MSNENENENAVENENATEDAKTKITVDKDKYQESRTSSGSKSLSNGDNVALALEGMTADEVYQVADSLIPENDFRDKYKHLNVGMQRMNVGNRIRGFVNKRDKENQVIVDFNANRKEDVEEKGLLPDAGELFTDAVAPIKAKVKARVEAKAAEAKAAKEAKEAKAAEAKAAKEAKAAEAKAAKEAKEAKAAEAKEAKEAKAAEAKEAKEAK